MGKGMVEVNFAGSYVGAERDLVILLEPRNESDIAEFRQMVILATGGYFGPSNDNHMIAISTNLSPQDDRDERGGRTVIKIHIPLTMEQVKTLEEKRPRHDPHRIEFSIHPKLLIYFHPDRTSKTIWLSEITFNIPISNWLEHLEKLGYGSYSRICIRYPPNLVPSIRQDIQIKLNEAQREINASHYPQALKSVRDAIELYQQQVLDQNPTLKDKLNVGQPGQPGQPSRGARYLGSTVAGESSPIRQIVGLLQMLKEIGNMTHPYYRVEKWDAELLLGCSALLFSLFNEELNR